MNLLRLLRHGEPGDEVQHRLNVSLDHLEQAAAELRAITILIRDERERSERPSS